MINENEIEKIYSDSFENFSPHVPSHIKKGIDRAIGKNKFGLSSIILSISSVFILALVVVSQSFNTNTTSANFKHFTFIKPASFNNNQHFNIKKNKGVTAKYKSNKILALAQINNTEVNVIDFKLNNNRTKIPNIKKAAYFAPKTIKSQVKLDLSNSKKQETSTSTSTSIKEHLKVQTNLQTIDSIYIDKKDATLSEQETPLTINDETIKEFTNYDEKRSIGFEFVGGLNHLNSKSETYNEINTLSTELGNYLRLGIQIDLSKGFNVNLAYKYKIKNANIVSNFSDVLLYNNSKLTQNTFSFALGYKIKFALWDLKSIFGLEFSPGIDYNVTNNALPIVIEDTQSTVFEVRKKNIDLFLRTTPFISFGKMDLILPIEFKYTPKPLVNFPVTNSKLGFSTSIGLGVRFNLNQINAD